MTATSRCWKRSTSSENADVSSSIAHLEHQPDVRIAEGHQRTGVTDGHQPPGRTTDVSRPVRCIRTSRDRKGAVDVDPLPCGRGSLNMTALGGLHPPFALHFAAQLAAGGVDLGAFAFANLHAHAGLAERVDQVLQIGLGRAAVRQSLHVVPRNQVDVRLAPRASPPVASRAPVGHSSRRGQRIHRSLAGRFLEEFIRGGEDGVEAGLLVGRHDSRAKLIVGGVQRHREAVLLAASASL